MAYRTVRGIPKMNRYDALRRGILEKAAQTATLDGHSTHVSTLGLGAEFNIPESHVRAQLLEFAKMNLISLVVWDGERERPYNDWPDADSFFFNRTDGGYVRIRLLIAGGELLSKLPKTPIGFVASSV
jgi:hypothetical protein